MKKSIFLKPVRAALIGMLLLMTYQAFGADANAPVKANELAPAASAAPAASTPPAAPIPAATPAPAASPTVKPTEPAVAKPAEPAAAKPVEATGAKPAGTTAVKAGEPPAAKPVEPATAVPPEQAPAGKAAKTLNPAPSAIPAGTPTQSKAAPMTVKPADTIITAQTDVSAVRLLSLDVLKKYNRNRRKKIQDALLEIYRDDPIYMAARAEITRPLSDDVVGPITLSYINRFWLYYNMEPVGNLTDASVDAMLHFAQMIHQFPDWRTDLLSAEFGRWIDSRPMPERAENYRIRLAVDEVLLPPLLRRYRADSRWQSTAEIDTENAPLSAYWYGLTAEDFKALGEKTALAPALEALKDETYASKRDFEKAVLDALKDTAAQPAAYLPFIERHARATGYKLSDKGMEKLRNGQRIPDEVLDAVEKLKDDVYLDKAGMEQELTEAIAQTTQKPAQFVPLILQEALSVTIYAFTDAVLEKLGADQKNMAVPPIVLKMLADLTDVQYPRLSLFDKAALAKLRARLGACPGGITNYEQVRQKDRKITSDEMQALKSAVGEPLGAQLEKLWNGGECDSIQLTEMRTQISELYGRYRPAITELVRKSPIFDATKHVKWTGNSCGCMNDQLSGEVYQFYPFWLAGEPQQVNFSTISRIGYYGVTFDEQGVLRMANDGRDVKEIFLSADSALLSFVQTARKHRTKLDWVVHKTDWKAWETLADAEKRKTFDQLEANIIGMLSAKLTDLPSRLLPYLSLGTKEVPVRGDGVTLYFDGYPRDETSVALFSGFLKKLQATLHANGFVLNILMRQSEMSKTDGIYSYPKLLEIIDSTVPPKSKEYFSFNSKSTFKLPNFLVLLDEPTTESKKKLRFDMESSFHGVDREKMLRQIVPVTEFDKSNWQQLEDDLIYYRDNFGGVGFWPLSMSKPGAAAAGTGVVRDGVQHCDVTQSIGDCLQDYYQIEPGVTSSKVCNIVCENRWAFRFALDVILLLLIAGAATYYRSCRWRPVIEKNYLVPLGAVAACIVIFTLLVSCDPYLNHLSQGYVIPVVLLAAIVGIVLFYRHKFKVRDEQP